MMNEMECKLKEKEISLEEVSNSVHIIRSNVTRQLAERDKVILPRLVLEIIFRLFQIIATITYISKER